MKRAASLLAAVLLCMGAAGAFSASGRTDGLWLKDYDVFWAIVEENYALYAAAERITGSDFAAVKQEYRPLAKEAETAGELFQVLDACVGRFYKTGHFALIQNTTEYASLAMLYARYAGGFPHCAYLYTRLDTPAAALFYRFDPGRAPGRPQGGGGETGAHSTGNLAFQDFPQEKAACVSIAQMTSGFSNNDGEVLRGWFSELEAKGYESCIIDIRGNGGGDSGYWSEYLVAPNLKHACTATNYALVKGSESMAYWQAAGKTLQPVDALPLNELPALPKEDLEGATHFLRYTTEWEPAHRPLFSGRFWLLVDEGVYSSSEMFAVFCKNTGFATLVGSATGGDGIGQDPLIFALPHSGICFRFSALEGLNADGSCNEEYGTVPDILPGPGQDALQACLAAIRAQRAGKEGLS